MSNINGGGGRRNMMSSVDFYRRVPKDLTEVRMQCIAWLWVGESIGFRGHFYVESYVGNLAGFPPPMKMAILTSLLALFFSSPCNNSLQT